MKLERALLCVEMDCQEVFAADGDCRCPACGNGVAFPVAQLLNGPTLQLPTASPSTTQATLVLPERTLASPVLVFDRARRLRTKAYESHKTSETAELADFRRYLETRMPRLDDTASSDRCAEPVSQAG